MFFFSLLSVILFLKRVGDVWERLGRWSGEDRERIEKGYRERIEKGYRKRIGSIEKG